MNKWIKQNGFLALFIRLVILLALLAGELLALPVTTARAAKTWIVTTDADGGDGRCNATCSLREAISVSAAGDTINFNGDFNIILRLGTLNINKSLVIDGSGHTITISGNNTLTPFSIGSGDVVTLSHLDITQGYAGPTAGGRGGGIYNDGTLTLVYSTISDSSAVYNSSGSGRGGEGGGIYNRGILTLTNSTVSASAVSDVSANINEGDGGGIYNLGTLTLTNSTISSNHAAASGGGIYNDGTLLTLTNSTIHFNNAHFGGGGIYNDSPLVVTGSTISENASGGGGGIFNLNGITGTISTSTISNNTAGSMNVEGAGGGIANLGTLTVANSTVAENSASSGGGIHNGHLLTVTNSTISANSAGNGSGIYNSGTLNYTDTIIAGPPGGNGNCYTHGATIGTNIKNLVQDGSCSAALRGDPLLAPLGDYGGLTQTVALLPGSLAIDAGNTATCPAADQRGIVRPQGPGCDIGSYESRGFALTMSGGDHQTTLINTAFPLPLSVKLSEVGGSGLPGAVVSFDAPVSGASLAAPTTATITTADGGIAALPATANGVEGPYNVSAAASNLTGSLNFSLTNQKSCLASIVVLNNLDSGPGSLREAIALVCVAGTISFGGDQAITLGTDLAISRLMTIDGTGHDVTISGNHATRVFTINSTGVILTGLTIINGQATNSSRYANDGGGIYNYHGALELTNSTLSGNVAAVGGSIYNDHGILTLKDNTLSGNRANTGGAIANDGGSVATVANSLLTGNSAGDGGGIYNMGALTVMNSTLSGNAAENNNPLSGGGGIYNIATLTVINSTFSGNSATSLGGGIRNLDTLNYTNTLIAGSLSGGDCSNASVFGTGTIHTNANNLVQDGSCSAALQGDPLLAPLGNYGGRTLTAALLPGSPAIGAGGISCPSTDQRGINRLNPCDIGAFESQGFQLGNLTGTPQSAVITTQFGLPLGLSVAARDVREPVDGGQITFTSPSNGASATVASNPATIAGGQISTTVTANGQAGGPYDVTASAAGAGSRVFSLTNTESADLRITQSVSPEPVFAGRNLTYTLTFTNLGPSIAEYVLLTDAVPAHTTFVSATMTSGAGWGVHSMPASGGTGNVAFKKSSVAPGESATIEMVVQVDLSAANASSINNTATVTTTTNDSVTDNDSNMVTSAVLGAPDLTITKTHARDFTQGQVDAQYTLTATNNGYSPTFGTVTVVDGLPAGLVATELSGGPNWNCVLGTLTCTRSDALAVGSSYDPIHLKVTVASNASASLTNQATVAGNELLVDNDGASDLTTVNAAPVTTIDTHPLDPANSASASFTFSGTGGTAPLTFECSLDGAAFAACSSPKSYSGLADVSHTFQVRTVDANAVSTSASYTWLVDTTAPSIGITEPNISPALSKTITASVSDGTLTMSNTSGSTCDGSLSFVAYASQTFTSETDNGTRVCYKAVDAAGNIAYSLSNAIDGIDTTSPAITINEPDATPASSKTITASASDGTLMMSNTRGSACDGSLTFVAYASQTFSSETDNGTRVCYWVMDTLGNAGYSLSNTITGIDTTAPIITISEPDASPAISKTITASASDGTLTMSNTSGSTCDGSLSFVAYASQTFTSETDNGIKVCYKAVDAAGNAAYSLSSAIAGIDTNAPVITISEPDATPALSKTITASASDGTLTMSNTNGSTCDASLTFVAYASQTFTSETDNGIRVCYRAVDTLGNTGYSLSNAIAGIDTTAPLIAISNPNISPATSKTITASASDGTFTMSNTRGSTCDASLTFVAYASQTFTSETDNGTRVCYRAVDALGNTGYRLSNAIAGIDTTAPDVTIALSAGQTDPTSGSPIRFTVVFSEPVSDFVTGEVDLSASTAPGTLTAAVSGGPTNFTMAVSGMTGSGTVTATIAAGVASDAAGNLNTASTSTDNEVLYDIVPPSVTIIQAAGQADPTGTSPINFTATFSEAVSDFTGGDVDLSAGTAPGVLIAVVTGGPTIYNVTVSGMTGDGSVIAAIPANAAQDFAKNGNSASTGADNTVNFVFAAPPVITEGASIHVTMSINSSPVPFALTLHATDLNLDPLTWDILTQTTHGIAGVAAGTGIVSYTPLSNYTGADSFVAQVSDGKGGTDSILVNVTIQALSTVNKINSVADTGDGQVSENEHTPAAITHLLVVFNNSMDGTDLANGAQLAANYTLFKEGSSSNLVNTAAYDDPSKTTTLGINSGAALPEGKYILTVKSAIRDSLGVALGADFVRTFFIDINGIAVITSGVSLPDGTVLVEGSTLNTALSEIWVSFSEDAANPAGDTEKEDVTNPANYLLVRPGENAAFETTTCLAGPGGDDVAVPAGPVTYTNGTGSGPFVAKVRVNTGVTLEDGLYKLFVCGTTSITDLAGNPLNNGTDHKLLFTVLTLTSSGSGGAKKQLNNPATGFEPGVFTTLPLQPARKAYADLGNLWIEIPSLKVKASITGVPLLSQGWDLTWLYNRVGWLEGTAYPTWNGNTVLTAHSYTSDGLPGPFALIKNLKYGNTFIIHFNAQKYTYTVRSQALVTASDTSLLNKHETKDWVTLITCQQFDEKSKTYLYRWVVRAILTSIQD